MSTAMNPTTPLITPLRASLLTFCAWVALAVCLVATPTHAVSVPALPDTSTNKLYIGLGAGFESGNGVKLGFSRGRHGAETGLGILYLGETGTLQYSYGLRYLYTLYDGAYAWAGGARTGYRDRTDEASMISTGAGIGVLWKLGSMFRLMLDSGWSASFETDDSEDDTYRLGPTVNMGLVYMW
jgi:hypothetical protein